MNLERLSITLRPRNPWEAMDLGVRFALRNALPLYAAWFSVTLPVTALVFGILSLSGHAVAWAGCVMWWLKPLFDRVALHVLSQMMFGETPTLRQTLNKLPGVLRHSRLLAALSWERFSLTRGVRLPVDLLEGLKGKASRERKALLCRRIGGPASWHTIFWLHLETLLWISLLGLAALLLPASLWPDADDFFDVLLQASGTILVLIAATQLACSLLLEPLYVAGGFMLYLKRRTDLEAWDVELAFRRLARRHARALLMPLLALALVAALTSLAPRHALADSSAELREARIERAAGEITEVMKDPVFGEDKTRRLPHWREDEERKDEKKSFTLPESLRALLAALGKALAELFRSIAELGRVAAWLLIVAAAGLLLGLMQRYLPNIASRDRPAVPAELAGFDIRPDSLPDDVAGTARDLATRGDARAALSLLFRATLSMLAHREGVIFRRGDTEGDCLERTHRQAARHTSYLARLLAAWQRLAYAHRDIPSNEVLALCDDWQRQFGGLPA